MPNGETLRHITHINVNYPAIPVLIYSMSAENVYASRVLKAGAKGFVSKMSPLDELCKAIGLAMNGKTYLSMVTAERLCSQVSLKSDSPFVQLSPRELEVVVYLLEGKTGTQISNELHLQKSTIGTHKSKIFQKLKVKNLLELKEMSDIHQL